MFSSMLSYTNLQEGYRLLKSNVDACKGTLKKALLEGKEIWPSEEAWLNTKVNLIDEELLLEQLANVESITNDVLAPDKSLEDRLE